MSIGIAPLRLAWEAMAFGPNVFTVPLTHTATASLVVVLGNRGACVDLNNIFSVSGILVSVSQCAPNLLIGQLLMIFCYDYRQGILQFFSIGKFATEHIRVINFTIERRRIGNRSQRLATRTRTCFWLWWL